MSQTPPPCVAPPAPGPRKRTVRTALQVLLAVLLAVPTAAGALTAAGVDVPPRAAALLIGIPAALVVLISAGQNAYDQHRGVG